jgi:peptidyl-prolyl cis-trans isomerase B (cyclophilin B)
MDSIFAYFKYKKVFLKPFLTQKKSMKKNLSLLIFSVFVSFFNGYAQDKNSIPVGQITTPYGKILISLDPKTPNHQKSFVQLAEAGYWDSLTFNRVIPNFVAQAGCPDTEEGFNDPQYLLAPEFHPDLTHVYGAVGAGRDGNAEKLSARCQFYIVQNPEGLHRLDGDYTVFGHVVKGMDVIEQIVRVKRDENDEPLKPVTLSIKILYLTLPEYQKLIN